MARPSWVDPNIFVPEWRRRVWTPEQNAYLLSPYSPTIVIPEEEPAPKPVVSPAPVMGPPATPPIPDYVMQSGDPYYPGLVGPLVEAAFSPESALVGPFLARPAAVAGMEPETPLLAPQEAASTNEDPDQATAYSEASSATDPNADINLSDQDIDYIARVVATEVPASVARKDPAEYAKMVEAVVDTVTNRVASADFPNTVEGVLNQRRAFSKITGPSRLSPYGSVKNAPKASKALMGMITTHLNDRAKGKPSVIGGATHYANPLYSDRSNLEGWINPMINSGVVKAGIGSAFHVHGTPPGQKAAPEYSISTPRSQFAAADRASMENLQRTVRNNLQAGPRGPTSFGAELSTPSGVPDVDVMAMGGLPIERSIDAGRFNLESTPDVNAMGFPTEVDYGDLRTGSRTRRGPALLSAPNFGWDAAAPLGAPVTSAPLSAPPGDIGTIDNEMVSYGGNVPTARPATDFNSVGFRNAPDVFARNPYESLRSDLGTAPISAPTIARTWGQEPSATQSRVASPVTPTPNAWSDMAAAAPIKAGAALVSRTAPAITATVSRNPFDTSRGVVPAALPQQEPARQAIEPIGPLRDVAPVPVRADPNARVDAAIRNQAEWVNEESRKSGIKGVYGDAAEDDSVPVNPSYRSGKFTGHGAGGPLGNILTGNSPLGRIGRIGGGARLGGLVAGPIGAVIGGLAGLGANVIGGSMANQGGGGPVAAPSGPISVVANPGGVGGPVAKSVTNSLGVTTNFADADASLTLGGPGGSAGK